MEIGNINVIGLVKNQTNSDDKIVEMLEKIATGNAILFTGSGFSSEMTNKLNNKPPLGGELANKIGKLGSFDADGDLMFASDYYIKYKNEESLIDLLRKEFSIKDVKPFHEEIIKEKWRRIYTTNYDDGIKYIATKNNLSFACISIDDNPKPYFKQMNTCIHINGTIDSLKNNIIPPSFKLTDSSYVSPESFENSNWYFSFRKDLEQSSAIIFVGYSLYDLAIKKILFETAFTHAKTYFIVQEKATEKSIFQLGQYGTVLTIGTEGFAKILKQKKQKKSTGITYFEAFEKYELLYPKEDITDNKIIDFLYHGNLDESYINASFNKNTLPYLIQRKHLIAKAVELLSMKNFLLILSDFGNGKSVFLKELAFSLSNLGKDVFLLRNIDGNYIKDIDSFAKFNHDIFLLIDDYQNTQDLVEYLLRINNQNIKVIISTRTSNHEHASEGMIFSDNINELSIDILEEDELDSFIEILDNLGTWESKAHLSKEKKLRILRDDNYAQISHTLLNIFNAPQIKERIHSLLKPLMQNKDYKDNVFAICILEVLGLPLTYSNISEVSLNNEIYSSKLINNSNFKQIFPSSSNHILAKSSLYARNLLQNHFTGDYNVSKLLDIVESLQFHRNNGKIEDIIYKNLLRFAFIESALPTNNKLNMITRYYEQLKARIHNLDRTPHFWLQYAMARIANDDIINAQKFLNTAYALAYEGYNTSYLDVQQARIYLFQANNEIDQNKSMKYFLDAHKLLTALEDGKHKYRQIETYAKYFNERYTSLSNKNKEIFQNCVTNILKGMEELNKGYFTESNRISICFDILKDVENKF